jgi:hypothetical protein
MNVKLITLIGSCLALLGASVSAQTLIHRYAFDSNANDAIGSLNGTLSTDDAPNNTEAPNFTTNTPTGADTSFASGSIELGMNASLNDVSFVFLGTPALYDGESGSFSLWFNPDATSGDELFSNVNPDPGNLRTRVEGSGAVAVLGGSVTGSPATSSNTASTDAWSHLVVTWDDAAGTGLIALNGTITGYSFTANSLDNPSRLMLGNFADNDNSPQTQFAGEFYDLQIYDGVLSSSQISQLNNNPGTAIPEPSSFALVAGGLAFVGLMLRRRR